MKKITYLLAVSAIIMTQALISCGDDKRDDTEFNNDEVPYDGKSERTFLEETATTFLDYFHPGDQRQLIQSLDYFVHICEVSDFPEFSSAAAAARSMKEAVAGDDYLGYSRAATDLVLTLSMFNGFYQHNYNTMVWQKLEDSDDVRLRYWDGSAEYNMSLSGSIDTWSATITDDDGSPVTIDVPKVLDFALVSGSTSVTNPNSILTIKLKTDFKDSERVSLSSEIKAANIFIKTALSGNNTTIDHTLTFSIDNVTTYYRRDMFSTKIKLTGSNLCSVNAWQKSGDEALSSMITNATGTLMILQRVQIKSEIKDMKTFVANCDTYFDKYNSTNPAASAEQAAKALTSSTKAEMFFTGDEKAVRATLGWEGCCYDDFYDEWGVRPLITFTSDNTPYSFEEYFGYSRFLSVENQFNKLFREYSSFIRHFN